MKVLYVSPFNQTGYGQAATRYVHSLHSVGVDVVCRPINLGGQPTNSAMVHELMQKPLDGVTHVVQHTLPSHYQSCGKVKQLGLFALETSELPKTWKRRLQLMDAAACISVEQTDDVSKEMGWDFPVYTLPHACAPEQYQRPVEPWPQLVPYKERGYYVFYGVGEWVRRKNWASLLRAYYGLFDRSNKVVLVIKTGIPGMSPTDSFNKINSFCQDIYAGMKLGPVKARPEVLICTDYLSEQQLLSLHEAGDCYVSSSSGEAWGLPAMDAMGMGRPVIVPEIGGYRDYVTNKCGFLVPVRYEMCFGAVDAVPEMYSAQGTWAMVDIPEFAASMWAMYAGGSLSQGMGRVGAARVYDFSYSKVGSMFRKVLEGM